MFNIKDKKIELLEELIGEILNGCNSKIVASEKAIAKMHVSDTKRNYFDVSQYQNIKNKIELGKFNIKIALEEYIEREGE